MSYEFESNGQTMSLSDIASLRSYDTSNDAFYISNSSTPYKKQGQAIQSSQVSIPGNSGDYTNQANHAYPNKGYVVNKSINEYGGFDKGNLAMKQEIRVNNGNISIPKGANRMIIIARGGGGGEGGGGGGARAMEGSDAWKAGGHGGTGEGGKFAFTDVSIPTQYANGNHSLSVTIGNGGNKGNGGGASHGYDSTERATGGNNAGAGNATKVYWPPTIPQWGSNILTANGGQGGGGGAAGVAYGPQFGDKGRANSGTMYNIGFNKQDYRRVHNSPYVPATWSVHYDYSGVYENVANQTIAYGRGGTNGGGGGTGQASNNTAADGQAGENGRSGFVKVLYMYGND